MYGSVYYDKKASIIHWSEYDKDGIRNERSKKWVPDFYIDPLTSDGDYKSQDGLVLTRINESTFKKRNDQIKMYKEGGRKVYGSDLSPENKFILETWPQDLTNPPNIRYMFIDIETECEQGFPDAEKAIERVNLITCWSTIDKKYHTFGLEHGYKNDMENVVEYVQCRTEDELLCSFIKYVERTRHDIWSGWNCLEENQTVWLKDRIVKIKNISKKDENIPLLELENYINKHVYTGEKDMFIIKNSLGKQIKCSKEHRFFVKTKKKDEYKKFSTLNKLQEEELRVEDIIEKQKTHDVFTKWELRENTNKDLTWKALFEIDEFWERLLKNPYIDFPIKNKEIVNLVRNDRSILIDYCYGKDFWKRTFEWNYKNNAHLYNSEVLRKELLEHDKVDYTFLNKRFYIKLDDKITENDLKILGFIFTDGCWDTSAKKGSDITFTQKYKDTLEKYKEIILENREINSITIKEYIRDREISPGKYYSMRITASNFALLLNLIYDFENGKKCKHPEITSLSMLSQYQFLSFFTGCYDGDGCSSGGSISLCNYDCKKFDFLQSLQELLLWNNIISTVTQKNDIIRISPDVINEKLFRYVKNKSLNSNRSKNITEEFKQNKQTSRKKIKYMYDDKIIYSKIESIEDTKEKVPMYDIETKTHSFLTGGCKTHNSSGFDVPYLFNRILRILDGVDVDRYNQLLHDIKLDGDKEQLYKEIRNIESTFDYIHRLSHFHVSSKQVKMIKDHFTKEMKPQMDYCIEGVTDYDYLRLDQQFGLHKRDSYKLDSVAQDELGEAKLKYDGSMKEFYTNEWNRFVDYNIHDVKLLIKLNAVLNYIPQAIALSYKCHCLFRDNFGTVTKVETAVYNFLFKDKVIMSDRGKQKEGPSVPGGFVTPRDELRRGMHKWIIDADVSSLYPSLMRGINISYDTKVAELNFQDKTKNIFTLGDDEEVYVINGETKQFTAKQVRNMIKEKEYHVSSRNVIFKNVKTHKGVLVKMLDMWYAQRKADKKLQSQYREKAINLFESIKEETPCGHPVEEKGIKKLLSDEQKAEYDECMRLTGVHFNLQWSCKILLNSVYGCIASPFSRFYGEELASSVTLSGQTVIKRNGEMLINYFNNELFKLNIIKKNFPNINHSITDTQVRLYSDTDSVVFDTIIRTNKGIFKIGDLYEMYNNKSNHISQYGHEIIDMENEGLETLTLNEKNNISVFGKIKKIIRHKVTKKKWRILVDNKQIIITEDHCCVIRRNGELLRVKPDMINKKTDKIITIF